MSRIAAWRILNRHGMPTTALSVARRSSWSPMIAIAACDIAGHRTDTAMAVHLATMGEPDDYIRARAATWNQRLRDAVPEDCE